MNFYTKIVLLVYLGLLILNCNQNFKNVTNPVLSSEFKNTKSFVKNQLSNSNKSDKILDNQRNYSDRLMDACLDREGFIKNIICNTGESTGKIHTITIKRSGYPNQEFGKIKYDEFRVRHNGNCGAYSLIPLLLSFDKNRLLTFFINLQIKFVYDLKKKNLNTENDSYYQLLRYTDHKNTYQNLLEDVLKLILCLKIEPTSNLTIDEQDILTKFIKETILLIYLSQGKLKDFYYGNGEFKDTNLIISENQDQNISSNYNKGLPCSNLKNWWLSETDISEFIAIITNNMSTDECMNEISQIFYGGDIIDVSIHNILKFTPPKILIKHSGDYFDYLVLKQ